MTENQTLLERLEGRIIAQELLSRIVMTALANGQGGDPVKVIDQIRQETFSTLQNLQRPVDDRSDRVWEYAVESLEDEFAAVRSRFTV
jgi:hypothetical protein